MDEVYVLDRDLQLIGAVDAYKSLIWADRYWDVGDCELYVPASVENVQTLQLGHFLMRPDSDMICEIRKIELTTSAEDGNYLTATGVDVKHWLDQRIVWGTAQTEGKAEAFIRRIVNDALGSTAAEDRQMLNSNGDLIFGLGTLHNFTTALTMQTSYKNVGEKVRELCLTFGWGYRCRLNNGVVLFDVYAGTDRTGSVIFAPEYDNLRETDYIHDETNLGNVALIAGEGQGSERSRVYTGTAQGLNRFELYVDAKDISKNITYEELTDTYPGGTLVADGDVYDYTMDSVDIQILNDEQLAELQTDYPGGTVVTVSGTRYYRLENAVIATAETDAPEDGDTVELNDLIYNVYLLIRGYEKMAEYGAVTSFDGSVSPDVTFVYNRDYFLGDIVTVENEYGITVNARIVEVVEVNDENGYSVEPKFEYITQEG